MTEVYFAIKVYAFYVMMGLLGVCTIAMFIIWLREWYKDWIKRKKP